MTTPASALPEEPRPLRMDAYYYGFDPTGVRAVDVILSAVACAGKGYHHTDGWTESHMEFGPFRGNSYVEFIQNAAKDAAELLRQRDAEIAALREDKERLDWLESERGIRSPRLDWMDGDGESLRQAIDAARRPPEERTCE